MDWERATEEEVLEEVLNYLKFRYDPSKVYYKTIRKQKTAGEYGPYWEYSIVLRVDQPFKYPSAPYPEFDTHVQITLATRPEFHEIRPKLSI